MIKLNKQEQLHQWFLTFLGPRTPQNLIKAIDPHPLTKHINTHTNLYTVLFHLRLISFTYNIKTILAKNYVSLVPSCMYQHAKCELCFSTNLCNNWPPFHSLLFLFFFNHGDTSPNTCKLLSTVFWITGTCGTFQTIKVSSKNSCDQQSTAFIYLFIYLLYFNIVRYHFLRQPRYCPI